MNRAGAVPTIHIIVCFKLRCPNPEGPKRLKGHDSSVGTNTEAVALLLRSLWPGPEILDVLRSKLAIMNKNTVICGIEHVLRNEGCNEIPVGELYKRVKKTRGNFDVSVPDFMEV